ncbi:MAG: nucleotidyltransferase family protein [Gammaproteobacteria bacterium]|nr:nucleotidyltransferase family protein [Gammaproteobacteria bacterium]MCY4211724.1 nucleotidyltransferase family protein [Gammaproteobacteria bacterium]MCY4283628.1 nucleotidyltransferase family protein [Gammaproteobacteria bacterium]MCY4338531.1 nucleotidyltransferase family protein [Gammaproteobacteria bacterium]
MNRDKVLDILRTHKAILAQRFGVSGLTLFGSVARDQANDDSDIDILVSYGKPATSKAYFGVQFYLEDLLGRQVDLVTDKALRREFRPYVEKEAIDV